MALLGQLRRRASLTADTGISRLLDELRSFPCDQPEPKIEVPGPGELSFFSTVAAFGTPLDVTISGLVIESFFPADAETAAALCAT